MSLLICFISWTRLIKQIKSDNSRNQQDEGWYFSIPWHWDLSCSLTCCSRVRFLSKTTDDSCGCQPRSQSDAPYLATCWWPGKTLHLTSSGWRPDWINLKRTEITSGIATWQTKVNILSSLILLEDYYYYFNFAIEIPGQCFRHYNIIWRRSEEYLDSRSISFKIEVTHLWIKKPSVLGILSVTALCLQRVDRRLTLQILYFTQHFNLDNLL